MKALLSTLAFCVVSVVTVTAIDARAQERIAIGSTATASPFYGYFTAVAQIINENIPNIQASVMETGATVDNLRRMSRDQVDMGLVTTNTLNEAWEGKGQFEGRPVKSKVLWVYAVTPQFALVREDSGVRSFADLNGEEFNPGLRGSSTEATTDAVFDTLDIEVDDFRGGSVDTRDAIKDNRIIGWVSSAMGGKLSSTQIDVHTFSPLYPLSLTEEQAELVRENHPELSVIDIPAREEGDMPAFTTWSFALATSAAPGMDEETGYQIVKSIMENLEPQIGAMSIIKDIDFAEATLEMSASPLHPGAIRYLREQGYEIPERLIAPEDR